MTFLGLAARNLRRNLVRTALTVVGVIVSVLTFVLLRTLIYSWTGAADYAQKDRVVTRHRVTFVMPLPRRYYDEVLQIPSVRTATFASWFGGKDPAHDTEFFATLAVDPKTYFEVYKEAVLTPEGRDRWLEDKSSAIVGDVLAHKLGWKVGDKVTLESGIYPAPIDRTWTFTIAGLYTTSAKSLDRSTFHIRWDYFNESLPENARDTIGWVVSRVTEPKETAAASKAIDAVFDSKDVQTLSQDEAAFNASFLAGVSAVLQAVNLISGVILIIMALILGNTIAMGVRERTQEYGVLRALGFHPRHILFFVLGEALVTGTLGSLLGVALSFPAVNQGIGLWLEENMGNFFPYFRIAPKDIALALGLSLGLSLLAALVPALGASRLKVTDALRRVA